ncbi:MAG: tellurite resistance TerB family protein [Devosia sp.]
MFNIDQILTTLKTDQNAQRAAMTGVGGLAAGLVLGRGGFGNLAKMGAVAALGGLAYKAWQDHQASQGDTAPVDRDAFIPPAQAGHQNEELSKTLVRAMIAATKADGQVDAAEKDAIFKKLETMQLGAEEKAFVFDELSGPLDINAVVARADSAEHGAEIYAASLVAMTADTPAERAYLDALAHKLDLAPGLVAEIHRHAGAQAPAPGTGDAGAYIPASSV